VFYAPHYVVSSALLEYRHHLGGSWKAKEILGEVSLAV
jgi:hypothetical protein